MIPMNTRCSREQVRHPMSNSSQSKEESTFMSATETSSSTNNSKSSVADKTMKSKAMLNTSADNQGNRRRVDGLYLSELDYRIPDLNATYDSIDQSSIKSVGTDGCTVTTGTTVHVSNGMTARLKKIFQRKVTRKRQQQEESKAGIPQSIQTPTFEESRKTIKSDDPTAKKLDELREKSGIQHSRDVFAMLLHNSQLVQSTTPTVRIEEEEEEDQDDIRDRSKQQFSQRKFTLSFVQNLFECCTTDEDVYLE